MPRAFDTDRSNWDWELIRATQDKRASRTSVPPGGTYELVGTDCTLDGGLRPHMGFKHVYTLGANLFTDVTPLSDNAIARQTPECGSGENDSAGCWSAPTVVAPQHAEFFPVTLAIDSNEIAYGFIWRVRDSTTPDANCRYFFTYRIFGYSEWKGPFDLIGWQTNGLKQMDVQTLGRFCYLGVAGSRPTRIWIKKTDLGSGMVSSAGGSGTFPTTANYEVIVEEDTGPGPQPSLVMCKENGIQAQEDLAATMPVIPAPIDGSPASARIVFFGLCNPTSGFTNTMKHGETNFFGGTGTPINGPSDLGLWDSSTPVPQADPTFTTIIYVYPDATLLAGHSGRKWEEAEYEYGDPTGMAKGEYTFAYQLFDSRSGLYSNVSQALDAESSQYGRASSSGSYYDAGVVYTVGGKTGSFVNDYESITFPAIDITYDSDKYDTLLVYRSLKHESNAALPSEFKLLSLDNVIPLADYHTIDAAMPSSGATKWKRAVYFYTLKNAVLSQQDAIDTTFVYDPEMPKAGALHFYDGTMLFGQIEDIDNENAGVSFVRWSDLSQVSVELVSPFSRQTLELPAEQITRWLPIGPVTLGLSNEAQYVFRKEGFILRGLPLLIGYGITGDRAGASFGTHGYFTTKMGIKRVTAFGEMDNVEMFDQVIISEWQATLPEVEMAYDAKMACLYVMNPEEDHMLIFWYNKQRASELLDVPFVNVREGDIPRDVTNPTSRLERRAIFLKESNPDEATYEWELYVVDSERERGGVRLLDTGGASRFSFSSKGTVVQFDGTFDRVTFVIDSATKVGTRVDGAYVYILDGAQAGRKAKIKRRFSNSTILFEQDQEIDWDTITVGTRVGISPVLLQWVGSILGLRDSNNQPRFGVAEYFQSRFVNFIDAAFIDVSGAAADSLDAKWQGLIFNGNAAAPIYTAFPTLTNGGDVCSIVDGPGNDEIGLSAAFKSTGSESAGVELSAPCPGIRIFCPDIDYTLLAVSVDGKMHGKTHTRRAEVS